jgi:hypothetical protein
MGECLQCGDCCKFLVFEVEDTKENREFYLTHGQDLLPVTCDMLLVRVDMPCVKLVDNKCTLHGTPRMPFVCRVFPGPGQELILPFCGYRIPF